MPTCFRGLLHSHMKTCRPPALCLCQNLIKVQCDTDMIRTTPDFQWTVFSLFPQKAETDLHIFSLRRTLSWSSKYLMVAPILVSSAAEHALLFRSLLPKLMDSRSSGVPKVMCNSGDPLGKIKTKFPHFTRRANCIHSSVFCHIYGIKRDLLTLPHPCCGCHGNSPSDRSSAVLEFIYSPVWNDVQYLQTCWEVCMLMISDNTDVYVYVTHILTVRGVLLNFASNACNELLKFWWLAPADTKPKV